MIHQTQPGVKRSYGRSVARIVADEELGRRLADSAARRVRDDFLGDRHLSQYVEPVAELLRG